MFAWQIQAKGEQCALVTRWNSKNWTQIKDLHYDNFKNNKFLKQPGLKFSGLHISSDLH